MLTKVEPPSRRVGRSGNGQVVGGVLVLLGVGWLLAQADVIELGFEAVLSLVLVALGVGLVLTARRSGGRGLVVLGVVLTVILAMTSSGPRFTYNESFFFRGPRFAGQRVLPGPTARFDQSLGDVDVDLTKETYADTRSVRIQVGAGDVTINVPPTAVVSVDVRAGLGTVQVFDRAAHDGPGAHEKFTEEGFDTAERKITIVADVGFGDITITREPAG